MANVYPATIPQSRRPAKGRGASRRVEKPKAGFSTGLLIKRLMSPLLIVAGLLLVAAVLIQAYQSLGQQKIRYMSIEGKLEHLSEDRIKALVLPYVGESLLGMDIGKVKEVLEEIPWINTVAIRREWPETLVVNVTEEVAIARWGKSDLLNQDGIVFTPQATDRLIQLPLLKGPDGSEALVMSQYQKFNQVLYPLGLKINDLNLSERGAWDMVLENGVRIKVGKSKVMEKMRRLVSFVDAEAAMEMDAVSVIDLRYSNGIAISKKDISGDEAVSL